jgi:hypothetical protein
MLFSNIHERTYLSLPAPIRVEPTIWAKCFFVDPVSDIAVLGPPDSQALSDQCEHTTILSIPFSRYPLLMRLRKLPRGFSPWTSDGANASCVRSAAPCGFRTP